MVRDNFTRGYELVMVLMDNASSPGMLYQLVATCSVGKSTFEKWPVGCLKRAISDMPEDLRQLAIAFIASTQSILEQDQRMIRYVKSLAKIGVECDSWGFEETPGKVVNCSEHQSRYVFFIEKYLSNRTSTIPDRLMKPLEMLKSLSRVYEAIELLSDADIWQSARPAHSEGPSAPEKHSIRRALWRFQIFCSLYWNWEESLSSTDVVHRNAIDAPFTRDQRCFLHKIGLEGTLELVKVYDDLLTMLQQIYASDLAFIFEDAFVDNLEFWENHNRRGLDFGDSCERGILNRSEQLFNGYLTYRLSMGVAYLAEMHRHRSPRVLPIHRQMDDWDWTQPELLLIAAFKNHSSAHHLDFDCSFSQHFAQWSSAYRLRPNCVKLQSPEIYCAVDMAWTVDEWHMPGWKLQVILDAEPFGLRRRHFSFAQPILLDYWISEQYIGKLPFDVTNFDALLAPIDSSSEVSL